MELDLVSAINIFTHKSIGDYRTIMQGKLVIRHINRVLCGMRRKILFPIGGD